MAKPPRKPKPPVERAAHKAARKDVNEELDRRLDAKRKPTTVTSIKPKGDANG